MKKGHTGQRECGGKERVTALGTMALHASMVATYQLLRARLAMIPVGFSSPHLHWLTHIEKWCSHVHCSVIEVTSRCTTTIIALNMTTPTWGEKKRIEGDVGWAKVRAILQVVKWS